MDTYREGFPDGGTYLPAGTYAAHIKEDSVMSALELDTDNSREEHASLVRFIVNEAPKIFATLIISELSAADVHECLQKFQQHDLTDDALPVERSRPIPPFEGNSRRLKMFCLLQWESLAPVFSKHKFMWDLKKDQPLPFMKIDGHDSNAGASSVVHKVKVHPDHLLDPPLKVPKFNWRPSEKLGVESIQFRAFAKFHSPTANDWRLPSSS
jgi:hypothetical protein